MRPHKTLVGTRSCLEIDRSRGLACCEQSLSSALDDHGIDKSKDESINWAVKSYFYGDSTVLDSHPLATSTWPEVM